MKSISIIGNETFGRYEYRLNDKFSRLFISNAKKYINMYLNRNDKDPVLLNALLILYPLNEVNHA